jgi:outer membrane protein assembly factor BamD (BamD/ComL family)
MTEFPTMQMFRKAAPSILLVLAVLGLLGACQTAPVAVAPDLDAPTLIQRAQEASDLHNYRQATLYYEALVERFGADPALKVAGDYELAFIALKEGRKDEARAGLEAVLARYKGPESAALPPRYEILAKKILATLE